MSLAACDCFTIVDVPVLSNTEMVCWLRQLLSLLHDNTAGMHRQVCEQ